MSGRLLVRFGDGVLQEFPIQPRLKIGSSAPSDVVLAGAGVLPLHATAEVRDKDCWIEAVGDGRIAVNGQPAEKRALRHLDVITLGDRVHVIFSTSASPLPQPGRVKKAAAAPSPAATPNVTRAFTREDLAAMFTPPPDEMPTQAPKTLIGIPVASPIPPVGPPPTVAPPPSTNAAPSNTIVGLPPGVMPPSFGEEVAPTVEFSVAPTVEFSAAAAASFVPQATVILQVPAVRPINSVRLAGIAGVFDAPLGQSLIGRGSKATVRIDSSEVSRVHALLIVSSDRVTIEDQKSSNGTTVNGVRITGEHVLAEGDLVSFGMIDLRVDFVRVGGG